MKPSDVHRALNPQHFGRSAGDAPNLGRVARMPGAGMPKGLRQQRKHGESRSGNRARSSRKQVVLVWSVVLMLVSLGVLGIVVWLGLRPSVHHAQRVKGLERDRDSWVERRITSQFPSPTEAEAVDLVKRALLLREPTAVKELFHLGSTSPGDAVEFLRNLEKMDGPVINIKWLSSMDANGLLIDGVILRTNGKSRQLSRLVMLTPDAQGRWKIDFDAFSRKVTPSWSELLEKKSAQGLVRVLVARDSYYNGCFKDDSVWDCYEMVSQDHEMTLLGYCRKGSPQAAAMDRMTMIREGFLGGRGLRRATLEIHRSEGSESRQFEITRVLAEDWVLAAKTYDEKFK